MRWGRGRGRSRRRRSPARGCSIRAACTAREQNTKRTSIKKVRITRLLQSGWRAEAAVAGSFSLSASPAGLCASNTLATRSSALSVLWCTARMTASLRSSGKLYCCVRGREGVVGARAPKKTPHVLAPNRAGRRATAHRRTAQLLPLLHSQSPPPSIATTPASPSRAAAGGAPRRRSPRRTSGRPFWKTCTASCARGRASSWPGTRRNRAPPRPCSARQRAPRRQSHRAAGAARRCTRPC